MRFQVEPLESKLLLAGDSPIALGELVADIKGGPIARVGQHLTSLYDEFQQSKAEPNFGLVEFQASNSLVAVSDDRVSIDAVAVGDARQLQVQLEELGLHVTGTFGPMVSGLLPIDAIDDLAALEHLNFARPVMAITNVGLTDSQGDVAMKSDEARLMFGVDGSGIQVGTLSDTFDFHGGAASDIANGDLPPASKLFILDDSGSFPPPADEGRAAMQLIRDVAPGASQAFHTAWTGQAAFALGIEELAGCPSGSEVGCTVFPGVAADVINDDIGYLTEPMFQDGIIAQAVDVVHAAGVSYFSAAGNDASQSYESSAGFVPSGLTGPLSGGNLHDFDPGAGVDTAQEISVPVGASVIFNFQWSEPFASVCAGCPGSASDFDIGVLSADLSTPLAFAVDANIGGDAVEIMAFANDGSFDFDGVPGPDETFNVIIEKCGPTFCPSAPDPFFMKYIYSGLGITVNEFDTASGTAFGHANAAGAETTGAAFYLFTPEFGTSPPVLEAESSKGGVPILYDTTGTLLPAPVIRQTPDITGPDGTNTTFFGVPDPTVPPCFECDGFPNFFGTSAAAPHASAVAALMLEKAGGQGSLTPAGVYGAMEATAIEMETPGYDDLSGHGFLDALAAVGAVGAMSPAFLVDTTLDVVNVGDGVTSLREAINASNSFAGIDTVSFDIPGPGPHAIVLNSALPTITDPVVIDGTTEPDYAGTPIIELDGSIAGAGAHGLQITAGSSTVRGLAINSFSGSGLLFSSGGGNTIQQNNVGTDATGSMDQGNSQHGILIVNSASNTIGGTSAPMGNTLSGNDTHGVFITGVGSSGNVVQNNRIGTATDGTTLLSNGVAGVRIADGASNNMIGGSGNVISGNSGDGVHISDATSTGNVLTGNFIGTDGTGTLARGNAMFGVRINNAPGNIVGGTAAGATNVISGNSQSAILITGAAATGNQVQGNKIGTRSDGNTALGNTVHGVHISNAPGNVVGGTSEGAANIISANGGTGVIIIGSNASSNRVEGNLIGVGQDQTSPDVGNARYGVFINNAPDNVVGGTTASASNVISDNNLSGILIAGTTATGNRVEGNKIGTKSDGNTVMGNTFYGVFISDAPGNVVGGTTAGAANIISGNGNTGVIIAGNDARSNRIEGNRIGVAQNETSPVGNGRYGVFISSARENIVGGTAAGAGNVISDNGHSGVLISGLGLNRVEGNKIGTKSDGNTALGNAFFGVYIGGSSDNVVGGRSGSAGNVISGNGSSGVVIVGNDAGLNRIEGNLIGVAQDETSAVGNGKYGVFLNNTWRTVVGGTAAGAGNVISDNGHSGVLISGNLAHQNRIEGNKIGTKSDGNTALGNALYGVIVNDAPNNTVGGIVPAAGNVISGNGNTGVIIVGNDASSNSIVGNRIGTTSDGNTALGNAFYGVYIGNAPDNDVGAMTDRGNIISGNGNAGVSIVGFGANSNRISGNLIGVTQDETSALGNGKFGVRIVNAPGNIVGGTTAQRANVISGNGHSGVVIFGPLASGNQVQGNKIGTKSDGQTALGNTFYGVNISGAPGNVVGGVVESTANVISGNGDTGVIIDAGGANSNRIEGNLIGVAQDGTTATGNARYGVFIRNAPNNTVGGTAAAATNVISGNGHSGVLISGALATGNRVEGNNIGTASDGNTALGNTLYGVLISNASGNTTGGLATGAENRIAFHGADGVYVASGINNAVLGNSTRDNTVLGIDLGAFGSTANDPDDPDAGANNLQNSPELVSAVLSGPDLQISYSVPSTTDNSAYPLRVEFFLADADNQEGLSLLDSDSYTAGEATAVKQVSIPVYDLIALDPLGYESSSEASNINDNGFVTGRAFTHSAESFAVTWLNSQPTPLPFPFGTFPTSVNGQGHIAGGASVGGGTSHAFFWDGNVFTDIHSVGTDSSGRGINDADEIVGWFRASQSRRAFRWKNGITIDLGTFGGLESEARDINQVGQVIGIAELPSGIARPFIWSDINNNNISDPGEMVQLPIMGLGFSVNALNDSGNVVGYVLENQFDRQAALWTDPIGFTLLGVLPDKTESEALDINNSGQVVGHSQGRAFIWENGQITDLNTLIPQGQDWELLRALAINDDGWIVGQGLLSGVSRGFLLRPVSAGDRIVASATDADGNTSEFSVNIAVT